MTKKELYNVTEKCPIQSIWAEMPEIMHFLHSFNALWENHFIVSTDILLSCISVDDGFEIRAFAKILEIDDWDVSDLLGILRMSISDVKNTVELIHKNADPVELSQLKAQAADHLLFSFFGTEHLQDSFFDIDHCHLVDGKHLELTAVSKVCGSADLSKRKTMDAIYTKVAETYPNAKIDMQDNTISISFS